MRSGHSIQKLLYCLALLGGMTISHSILGRDASSLYELQRLPSNDSLPHSNLNIDASSFENENILRSDERIADKVRKTLFVFAQVSKSECFVGEPLTVTYKLYSRLNAKSSIVGQPVLAGFSKNDIVNVAGLNPSIERIGGKAFQVYILRKTQVIPLIAGNLEIDQMEVEHKINFTKSDADSISAGGQLTDFLHQKKEEEQAKSISATMSTRSSALRITVSDLPEENKPSGYGGAVGSFSIKTSLSSQKKITGGTAVIILEIKGKGSLVLTEPPGIKLPNNIELLSVKPLIGSHKTNAESNTSRSFEYLVVFSQPGLVKIPPISFSYFDPTKRIYKTIHSMPIVTEILENPTPINSKSTRTQLHPAGKGKSAPVHTVKNAILLFILAIAGSIVLFWKKTTRSGTHFRQVKSKRNDQGVDTPFTRAAGKLCFVKDMDKNDLGAYYYELNKVLWAVITEKIDLLPTELSKGNIFTELSRQGWTPEEVWDLELTMNEYERNLYVPGYKDENDFERVYNKAVDIISKLEQLPPVSIGTIYNSN